MTKLILDVKPENLVAYGNLRVAFFDRKYKINRQEDAEGNVTHGEEVRLYIHIENVDDPYSTLHKKAGSRKVMDENQEFILVAETTLFKRAYEKYLNLKKGSSEPDYKSQLEEARKRIVELESKEPLAENAINGTTEFELVINDPLPKDSKPKFAGPKPKFTPKSKEEAAE